MQVAIEQLRVKGVEISDREEEAACLAILLHDIGHGPFSHALEKSFFKKISHEQISIALMRSMNEEFDGDLNLAIEIFTNQYPRKFFHQLISSQLDVDRLDYLKRDSFYSGVIEGNIAVDRILAMIDVVDNEIVVHEKGIMSVQHFLLSRNLMYWQVYLHKTVMSAEFMLIKFFERIYELIQNGEIITSSNPRLNYFFQLAEEDRSQLSPEIIAEFVKLDDSDVWTVLKDLQNAKDEILSNLARRILARQFYKVCFSEAQYKQRIEQYSSLNSSASPYFHFSDTVTMVAYSTAQPIQILTKGEGVLPYEDYIAKNAMIYSIENKTSKTFYYSL
jgi:HD superfamily phosphohydrolase